MDFQYETECIFVDFSLRKQGIAVLPAETVVMLICELSRQFPDACFYAVKCLDNHNIFYN